MYAPSDLVRDMRKITSRTDEPAEILRRLRDPASRLALSRQWLERRFYGLNEAQGFDIYPLHEEADHTLSVVVASLLPGHSLPPHDHRTWALQVGIEGYETNIDWRRTDDGSRPGYAVIEEAGRTIFGPGEVVSFMPNDIHSVVNESDPQRRQRIRSTASSTNPISFASRSIYTASAAATLIRGASIPLPGQRAC
jgi:predicted metal-dependent enzyme (double-stranded beta helix superfamily)